MALDVEALMRSAALDMTHEDEHFIADASARRGILGMVG